MPKPKRRPATQADIGTAIVFAGICVFAYAGFFAIVQKTFPGWVYLTASSFLLISGIAIIQQSVFSWLLHRLVFLAAILVAAQITGVYALSLANPFFLVPMLLSPVTLILRLIPLVAAIIFVVYLYKNRKVAILQKGQSAGANKPLTIPGIISLVDGFFKRILLTPRGAKFTPKNFTITVIIGIAVVVIIYSLLKPTP